MKELEHLYKWWWSPRRPTTYTVDNPETGTAAGLGRLIQARPEFQVCFNLTWYKYKNVLHSWDGQTASVTYAIQIRKVLDRKAEGGTLGELSCLLPESDFFAYCKANRIGIDLVQVR
jgi:hypothetical protein